MSKLPKYCLVLFFLFLLIPLLTRAADVNAAEPRTNTSAVVSWQGVDGAFSYNIYFKEMGESNYTHAAADLPADARSFTLEFLKSGVKYIYKIAAVNGEGKEFWFSEEKSFFSGAAAVVSPVSPVVKTRGESNATTSATASWLKQPKAEYYNIYYKEVGEPAYTHAVARLPREATSLKINFLKKGVGYRYQVAAFYDGAEHWLGEKVLIWPVQQPVKGSKMAVPVIPEKSQGANYLPLPTVTPLAATPVPRETPPTSDYYITPQAQEVNKVINPSPTVVNLTPLPTSSNTVPYYP